MAVFCLSLVVFEKAVILGNTGSRYICLCSRLLKPCSRSELGFKSIGIGDFFLAMGSRGGLFRFKGLKSAQVILDQLKATLLSLTEGHYLTLQGCVGEDGRRAERAVPWQCWGRGSHWYQVALLLYRLLHSLLCRLLPSLHRAEETTA